MVPLNLKKKHYKDHCSQGIQKISGIFKYAIPLNYIAVYRDLNTHSATEHIYENITKSDSLLFSRPIFSYLYEEDQGIT